MSIMPLLFFEQKIAIFDSGLLFIAQLFVLTRIYFLYTIINDRNNMYF